MQFASTGVGIRAVHTRASRRSRMHTADYRPCIEICIDVRITLQRRILRIVLRDSSQLRKIDPRPGTLPRALPGTLPRARPDPRSLLLASSPLLPRFLRTHHLPLTALPLPTRLGPGLRNGLERQRALLLPRASVSASVSCPCGGRVHRWNAYNNVPIAKKGCSSVSASDSACSRT